MREIMNSHPRVTWALGTLAYDENSAVVKLLLMKGMGIDFRHADSFQTSQQ
jgi:hypothetical protein